MDYIKIGTNKGQYVKGDVEFSSLDVGDEIFVNDDNEIYGDVIKKVHKSTSTFIALECEDCIIYLEVDSGSPSFGIYVLVTDRDDDRILTKFYSDIAYLDGDGYVSQGRIRSSIKDLF